MDRKSETFCAVIEGATNKAVKVDFGNTEAWIPRSLIVDCDPDIDTCDRGDIVHIELPEWLAKEKGVL